MGHWYTLYTRPTAEYQVAAVLQEREIQTYLPEIEVPRARRGPGREPFFPCYLFIKVDFEQFGLSHVQWAPGLRRIVSFDGQPAPLPDEVIGLIRRKLDGTNTAGDWSAHTFQPGEAVQIIDGPLQGMLAIFEGPNTPAERVQVLLTILGHFSRAHLSAAALQKVPATAQAPVSKRPRRTRGRGRRIKSH